MSEEASLIEEYFKGNEQALTSLVKKYTNSVFGFVYTFVRNSEEAEDITQETFLKVWRNLKKFDQKKEFKVWLLTIAKNTALDYLRKRKAVVFSQFENEQGDNMLTESLADDAPLAHELFETQENTAKVQAAVKELSTEEQIILVMHEIEGLTFAEIAEVLEESQNTLKSRYRRSLIKLKTMLENKVTPAAAAPKNG